MSQEAQKEKQPSARETRVVFPEGKIVAGYKVLSLLGQGGFGDVYKVRDMKTSQVFAMKTEYLNAEKTALFQEIQIFTDIKGDCFPTIRTSGEDNECRYVVMNLLGPSIGNIRREYGNRIPMKITLPICIEMLKVISVLHKLGFIHRDIKPSNFLLQDHPKWPLCLIDFGLAKRFIDPETGKPYPEEEKPRFTGTKKYASIFVHNHQTLCPRDDLISWFYSLVEMLRGKLPWHSIRDRDEMRAAKEECSIEELCRPLPKDLIYIYNYLAKLNYADQINFDYIIGILVGIMNNYSYPTEFNWSYFYSQRTGGDAPPSPAPPPQPLPPPKVEEEEEEDEDEEGGCCIVC